MTAPFGIELERPLDSSIRSEEIGATKLSVEPPKPHPGFTAYYVETGRRQGVVWIKGVGPSVDNDSYGNNVRTQLERVSTQLASRYGAPRKVDLNDRDGIWNEPRYWIASVHEQQRVFHHVWERGKAALPDDIETVFLGIVTYGHDSSAIILEYISPRHGEMESDRDIDLADLL